MIAFSRERGDQPSRWRAFSLVAFLVGLGCVFAALSVRILYTPQRLVDWQAIQIYCIQWLLGAVVAFAAGILLKTSK